MFGKKWYDDHPKVSLAVGCLENATHAQRNKIAKMVNNYAAKMGIKAKTPLFRMLGSWYDRDRDLSLAMQHLKKANDKQKQDLAEHIINSIREMNY